MKTALCLLGKVGGKEGKDMKGGPIDFEYCFESFKKKIIDVNKPIDVFIHSWSVEYKDSLVNLYKPKKFIFEPQIQFSPIPRKDDYRLGENAGFRAYSRWYSSKKAVELKREYELENNFIYDAVMLVRMDLVWFTQIDFKKIDLSYFYANNMNTPPMEQLRDKEGKINKPDRFNHSEKKNILGDLFFISNSKTMDAFSTLYDNLQNYSHWQHQAAWQHLDKVTNGNARKTIKFLLYRWFDFELYRWKVLNCYE